MSPDEFDSLADKLKKLPSEFKALVEKRIELFTLEMGERVANLITHAMYRVTGVLFLALGLILILFAASKLVGDLIGNEGLGFVLVSLPILLVGFMFFLRRPRTMVIRTRDRMLNQFMKDFQEQMSQFGDEENATPEKSDDGDSTKTTERQSVKPQE
jgi:hypothetical protein